MTDAAPITATPWKESSGTCACCGRASKTIWGDLSVPERTLAVYFVQWTIGSPEHPPNIDLVIGPWGEGTSAEDRVLVSVLFQPSPAGGSFMVIDGEGRRADDRSICKRSMRRMEVVGTPLAQEAFRLIDALWLTEPRLSELKGLGRAA